MACNRRAPAALAQAALEERLAPLAFLYLLHPHRPAAAAAHQLLCALMVAVPEAQRRPLAAYYVRRSLEGCPGATPLQQFGQVRGLGAWSCGGGMPAASCSGLRSNSTACSGSYLSGLARLLPRPRVQGLATILQALPVGSPVGVLCLERVLDKAGELAARCVRANPR